MTKITDFIEKNKYPLILILLVLVLCVYPLSFTQIYSGHDLKFHLCRIDCIADNIAEGHWFSPIYTTHLDGYGYASPMFYGDIFLHIPGFLTYLGMTPEASLRVFIMIITAFTSFVTYFCAKHIFKNGLGAFVASVAYTFSSYFCVDFITRVALGELQAFVFLPIIACGFYSIVFEKSEKWWLLPLGLTGCVLSHVMTSVLCVVFLAIFALIYVRRFAEKPKRLAVIAVCAAVFFCLSAFFIFPLLEQMTSHSLAINDGSAAVQWGTLADRAMPSSAVFSSFVIFKPVFNGINYVLVLFGGWPYAGGNVPWIPNGMGVLPIVIFVIIFACEILKKKVGKATWPLFLAGFVTLLCTTNLFPWKAVQSFLGSLQFPWRLLLFVTFFFAFAACSFVSKAESKKLAAAMAVSVVVLSLFAYCYTGIGKYSSMYSLYEKGETRVIDYENTIGAGEYMPTLEDEKTGKLTSAATIKSRILKRGDKVTSNNILSGDMEYGRDFDTLTVLFEKNGGDDTYIELPLLMYKGYSATVNGTSADVTWGKDNVVRVDVGGAESGKMVVRYTGTPLRKVCVVVSALSFIALAAYLVSAKIRKHRTK